MKIILTKVFIFVCSAQQFILADNLSTQFQDYPIIIHSGSNEGVFISSENGCHVMHHKHRISLLHKLKKYQSYKISPLLLKDIIQLCEDYENDKISPLEFVSNLRDHHRFSQFIYPGTKYCGVGNSTTNPDDLGEEVETDKCCRDHDGCQEYVVGFSCHPENGLCNNTPFTRSSCRCDDKFRGCLLAANETISSRIGKLYFNVFGLKCYRTDYPIVKCLEYGGFMNIHCQKYLLDTSKQPRLQFFDSPKFIPLSEIDEEKNEEVLIEGYDGSGLSINTFF